MKKPQSNGHDALSEGKTRKLRSSEWFNDPTNFEELVKIYSPLVSFGDMPGAEANRRVVFVIETRPQRAVALAQPQQRQQH